MGFEWVFDGRCVAVGSRRLQAVGSFDKVARCLVQAVLGKEIDSAPAEIPNSVRVRTRLLFTLSTVDLASLNITSPVFPSRRIRCGSEHEGYGETDSFWLKLLQYQHPTYPAYRTNLGLAIGVGLVLYFIRAFR